MASMEMEIDGSGIVSSNEIKQRGKKNTVRKRKNKSKRTSTKETFHYLPKFRCFSLKSETDGKGNFDMEVEDEGRGKMTPTHLIIMVNGLIGRLIFSVRLN